MPRKRDLENAWGMANPLARGPRFQIEYLLGALLIFDGVRMPFLPIPVPGAEIAAIALLLVGATRRPQSKLVLSWWIVPLLLATLGYLVAISVVNDVDFVRRAFRLLVFGVLIVFAGTRRLHVPNLITGLAVALIVNVPLHYSGLAASNPAPFLTGFVAEKNAAGLLYAVIGVLWAGQQRSKRNAIVVWVLFGVFVFLTGSRTSMSGYGMAAAWLFMRATWAVPVRLLALALGVWILDQAEKRLARVGIFADRVGTDWFRERIDQAAQAKLAASPWYGDGLAQAFILFDDGRRYFFHNSFDSLRVEGGWPLVAVVTVIYVVILLRPLRDAVATHKELYIEAATIATLICAWKLGEVLLATWTFMLIGLALQAYERPPTESDEDGAPPIERLTERVQE